MFRLMKRPAFWSEGKGGWQSTSLIPIAWAYQWCHRKRYATSGSSRANIPVICIGNVIVGGSGKTPVALDVARILAEKKKAIHFLSRGYGGSCPREPVRVDPSQHSARYVGDEPLILARHAITWVSPDRVAAAESAISNGAEVIIMDDGFQNPRLMKDLSILVFDGEYGIGNGALLPAGPMREPLADAISRAQAAVIVGRDSYDLATTLSETIPVFAAQFIPSCNKHDTERPVIAFSGIGSPEKFFSSIKAAGYNVCAKYAFPDHHPYSASELRFLHNESRKLGAKLMTTEKDFVRLGSSAQEGIEPFLITLLWSDETAFSDFLGHQLEAG